jgi:DNA-binding IclR family transcriptional regulator
MDALTAPTHRDALRVAALAGDAGVTAGSVSSELKATRAHVLNVLNELEAQGFLKGTPAKGRRRPGVATVYRIQPAKVDAAVDELRAWLTGEVVSVSPARKTRETEKGDLS